MLGPIFVFGLLIYICVQSLTRPYVGVVGYYGFAMLQPQWNWRWSLPPDFPFQKYIVAATMIGFLCMGLRGIALRGFSLRAILALVLFLAIAYLAAMSSINPPRTAFYMGYLWKLVLMACMALILLDTPYKVTALLWAITLGQGYNAYQITDYYFHDGFCRFARNGSYWGYQGDNNGYANVTVALMGISAALAVYAQQRWQRLIAAAIFILQAHQLMLLESRGGMLGGIAVTAVFAILVPKNKLKISRMAVIATMVLILAGPSVVKEFSSIFEAPENRDSSAESRFLLWDAGARITADFPWLGVGPDAGRYLVPSYYHGKLPESHRHAKALHNLFFELTTGVGIPATVLYLAFFFMPVGYGAHALWKIRKKPLPDWAACAYLGVSSGIIGYWVSSMFSSGALFESSYACAAAGLAAIAVMQRVQATSPTESYALTPSPEIEPALDLQST
ncbi:MAG TPA: hypothetical protein DCY79_08340 [Planctomycetaceae bacterium]|nr:hypothetical protein [Blastopirellula sp.]HAY79800.1 hypothetical protein [Planctomycetaceae bacterium]